jgi:ligand-binding sensor domain-containing protein
MKIRILIFLCILSVCLSMTAQTPFISDKSLGSATDYTIENWNSENGLSQNSIVCLYQTHDGFLWMSTTTSLTRFDGKVLTTFNASSTKGLTGTCFPTMYEDRKGVLWLISLEGKLIRYEQGVFETMKLSQGEGPVFKAVCENEEGNLLAGTTDNKVYLFSKGRPRLLTILPPAAGGIYRMLFADEVLYIGAKRGLFTYRNHLLLPNQMVKDSSVLLLKYFPGEGVWAYDDYNLYRLRNGICERIKLPPSLEKETNFRDFCLDAEKRLWICCKKGVALVDGNSCKFYGSSEGLSSELTTVICRDKEENLWVGTSDAGLNKMKPKTFRNYSKKDGLAADPTGCLLLLKNNSLLISNYCDGLNKIDQEKIGPFMKEHLGCIWALMEDSEGDLWVGTYSEGLSRYHSGKWIRYTMEDGLPSNAIFGLYQDQEGTLWIGTDNGVCIRKNDRFSPFQKGKIKGTVCHIMQDSQKRYWFCSSQGLGLLENGLFRILTTSSGLSSNVVRSIYEDRDGVYWIATYGGGLNRIKNGKIVALNKLTGLIDDYTSCILEDQKGYLWISSNRGIYRVKRTELNSYADGHSSFFSRSYFGLEEGLKNSECNGGFQPSGVKTPEGKIWFPTIVGVVMADTKNIPETSYLPEVYIEKITADDQTPEWKDSICQIGRDTRKTEFHFTAPFFGGDHNLFFQYRLEGRDKNWSNPTEARQAEYFDLQPGDYAFHIRIYGQPGSAEKSILLTVPYPFWRTWTFYTLICLLTAAAVFGYTSHHTNTIKIRETEKTLINKNYAALELKALQGQMNPHFTFNCLNTIKYFIASDDKVSANKYLGKFSRLIRMFLQHSSSNFITLDAETEMLTLYIELEQLRLDHDFDFTLFVDPALDPSKVEIPGMLMQPFVENAIHHGLRNSEGKRSLKLNFRKELRNLILEVEDNGVGRKKAAELKSNSILNHISMGIRNTEERISTINYIKSTNISLQVTDLTNESGDASGTLITVSIPFTEKTA